MGCSKINPKDNNGDTPLSEARKIQNVDVVEFYLECGYNAGTYKLTRWRI